MATTITIRDESPTGTTINEIAVEFVDECVSVRELIRSRVYQEVKDYNAKIADQKSTRFLGLVEPTETEIALNGDQSLGKKKQQIEWKRQFERALSAVRENQILILVDDRQVESLDEKFTLTPNSKVSFLRLALLTGG